MLIQRDRSTLVERAWWNLGALSSRKASVGSAALAASARSAAPRTLGACARCISMMNGPAQQTLARPGTSADWASAAQVPPPGMQAQQRAATWSCVFLSAKTLTRASALFESV